MGLSDVIGKMMAAKAPEPSAGQVERLARRYYQENREASDLPPGLREAVAERLAAIRRGANANAL